MKKAKFTLLSALLMDALCLSCATNPPREGVGEAYCPEMSGMIKSRQYPDVYWVHGDSGNEDGILGSIDPSQPPAVSQDSQ